PVFTFSVSGSCLPGSAQLGLYFFDLLLNFSSPAALAPTLSGSLGPISSCLPLPSGKARFGLAGIAGFALRAVLGFAERSSCIPDVRSGQTLKKDPHVSPDPLLSGLQAIPHA